MPRDLRTVAPLVAAAAVVGGIIAGMWALEQPDSYRATAVAVIGPSPSLATEADLIDVVGSLDRTVIAATAAGIAESRSVRDEAVAVTGFDGKLGDYDVAGVPVLGASLVDVVVTGPDSEMAAALANAIIELVQQRVAAIYKVYQLDIVTLATPPDNSGRPPVLILMIAGAAAGAALTALVVYATAAGRRERSGRELVAR